MKFRNKLTKKVRERKKKELSNRKKKKKVIERNIERKKR